MTPTASPPPPPPHPTPNTSSQQRGASRPHVAIALACTIAGSALAFLDGLLLPNKKNAHQQHQSLLTLAAATRQKYHNNSQRFTIHSSYSYHSQKREDSPSKRSTRSCCRVCVCVFRFLCRDIIALSPRVLSPIPPPSKYRSKSKNSSV